MLTCLELSELLRILIPWVILPSRVYFLLGRIQIKVIWPAEKLKETQAQSESESEWDTGKTSNHFHGCLGVDESQVWFAVKILLTLTSANAVKEDTSPSSILLLWFNHFAFKL